MIRGLSPYPAAWCTFKDAEQEWSVKIYDTKMELSNHNEKMGAVISTKKEMKIAVEGGFIQIVSIQFPGKKKMLIHELLNGMTFSEEAMVF